MKTYLLLTFVLGCSAAGEGMGQFEVVDLAEDPDPVIEVVSTPAEIPAFIAFSAPDEYRADVEGAITRWIKATGLDIRYTEGGTYFDMMPQVFTDDGNEVCGWARFWESRILIATDASVPCNDRAMVVAHEMGHAIHNASGHSTDGLMASGKAPWGTKRNIDQTSLDLVCGAERCPEMNVEEEVPADFDDSDLASVSVSGKDGWVSLVRK